MNFLALIPAKDWLYILLFTGALFGEWEIYHKGYQACETQVLEAANKARFEEQTKAIAQANELAQNAATIIQNQKDRTNNLQEQLNALQKNPCDNVPLGDDARSLSNSRIPKTYNSKPPF